LESYCASLEVITLLHVALLAPAGYGDCYTRSYGMICGDICHGFGYIVLGSVVEPCFPYQSMHEKTIGLCE
jgi:hypothetical protein